MTPIEADKRAQISLAYAPSRWRSLRMKLTYVIQFVGDMDRAVAFHRDTLGLPLTFSSPSTLPSVGRQPSS